ncbi:MAG: NADAR family protein [Actinophytocola sp.]|uniref:NADAR family protein n=1 Tax=Actinophytocola sp. TaxID=1872138 RepID=UPI003C733B9A
MGRFDRTFREVDGERVEGTWRPVFIRNGGTYFLTSLKIYADGVIDCWEHVTLDEFAVKVRTGWVATTLPDGARASAHHVATWNFANPMTWVDEDGLIGEVADEIDRLAGRPDSTGRCLAAADVYRHDRTEANRAALEAAYLAIPEHLRGYALGDMDRKDGPLRALFGADNEARQRALDYFADQDQAQATVEEYVPADGPARSDRSTITIRGTVYPPGWPDDPGLEVLQNTYPAPITFQGGTYPSVTHAYWALSTSDERARALIAETTNPFQARKIAEAAPRREGWADARVAVMSALMREKYRAHPRLADVLLSTGDAQLVSNEYLRSAFWSGPGGRHWLARLLEVVRSELAAARAGISVATQRSSG